MIVASLLHSPKGRGRLDLHVPASQGVIRFSNGPTDCGGRKLRRGSSPVGRFEHLMAKSSTERSRAFRAKGPPMLESDTVRALLEELSALRQANVALSKTVAEMGATIVAFVAQRDATKRNGDATVANDAGHDALLVPPAPAPARARKIFSSQAFSDLGANSNQQQQHPATGCNGDATIGNGDATQGALISRLGLRVPGGVSPLTDELATAAQTGPVTQGVAQRPEAALVEFAAERESGELEMPRVASITQRLPPVFDPATVNAERARQLAALRDLEKGAAQ